MIEQQTQPGIERRRETMTPQFEAGSVAILAIGNLTIKTEQNLRRLDEVTVSFPGGEVHNANLAERKRWEAQMEKRASEKGEEDDLIKKYRLWRLQKEQWEKDTGEWVLAGSQGDPPPYTPVPKDIGHPLVRDTFHVFAGIRDFHMEGTSLLVDTFPVTYPTYANISKEQDPKTSLEFAAVLGNPMIVFTADGKMIVQHRSAKNRSYGDMIGASAAGLMDAEFYSKEERGIDPERRGKIKPLTQEDLVAHMQKELFEEIKLSTDQIDSLVCTGFAQDKKKPHYEVLWLAQTRLTAAEVVENAAQTKTDKELTEQDFDEKFFILDGTKDAIIHLLTDSNCPLPPTHTAAFISALYHHVEQEEGTTAAQKVLKELQPKLAAHLVDIDRQVKDFYTNHPDQLPEKYNGQIPSGYDPAFLPQQQGLPSVLDELRRLNLLS